MKKPTSFIKSILLLMMLLLLPTTAKAQSYTSCVGGDPIYLPDPQVPSTYTLMWAQYSYSGTELYVVNNKVTIEKYFVGTIYVECYFKCVRQYTVAGRMYEDHQTGTTYFGIKCDPVYTTGLPDQLTMQVGETKTIDWSYRPSYVSRPNLTWTSSDYSVVDVNSNRLTAKKSGRAVVTVKSNAGPDESISVTVEGGSDVIYVSSISLNETSVSLTEGSTKQLQATVLPSNATDKSVSWTSSNNNVAQVSSSGLVTAKSVGTATITCKANDGSGKSATCSVTVKSSTIEPTSISLPASKTIKVGESFTMTYTLIPSNATTTLTWSSDDTSIATVSSSGDVKGIKAGTTKIRVKTANGKTDYCSMTVEANTQPKLTLSASPNGGKVSIGATVTLTVKANYCIVSGCDIYYTLNGDEPTTSSKKYTSSGITINSDCTIKAIAYKDGYDESEIFEKKYSIKIDQGVQIKTGYAHSLIIDNDGVLWACGNNRDGQLGNGESGSSTKKSSFIKVMDDVRTAVAGNNNTLIIKNDGSLWGCGNNFEGQLGDSSTEDRNIPVKIMDGVKTVAAGWGHTLILKNDGSLWACGSSYAWGEIENRQEVTIPIKIMEDVEKIAAGEGNSFVIKRDGSLWAGGLNNHYQLGDGTNVDRSLVKIMDDVDSVATYNECHYTLFLKKDGSLWGCGENYGQLYIAYEHIKSPINLGLTNVTSVSAGRYHILALTGGTMWAVGYNEDGELCDGTTNFAYSFKKIQDNVSSIAAGGYYSMFLKKDGTIWSCGSNIYGQLGDGTTIERHTPVCVQVSLPKIHLAASPIGNEVSKGTIVNLTTKVDDSSISGCNIYYTLDGSTPSKVFGTKYTSSGITINESCRLRAIAYKDRYEESDVLTETYIVKHPANEGYYYVGSMNGWNISDKSYPFIKQSDGKTWVLTMEAADDDQFKIAIGSIDSWNGNIFGIPFGNNVTAKSGIMTYDFDGSENFCVKSETGMRSYTVHINPETMYYEVTVSKAAPKNDITLSSSGYATFYSSESAYILPNGLSAQVVTGANNNKLTYKTIADGSVSGVVPKGVPVMLVSDNKQAGTYTLTSSESAVTYTGTNLLHGSDKATTTTGDGYHYKLSYGPTGTKWDNVFGWYWGANDGAPFQIEEHKAWLVVPRGNGTRAAGFSIEGDVLGIETLEELADSPLNLYFDLQGRRVSQPTKRGVYVSNGKKIILK